MIMKCYCKYFCLAFCLMGAVKPAQDVVPCGMFCRIKFSIGHNGNIESFKFVERSNVLLNDLSIIKVAKNFKFEERLWGTEFIINFKQ